MKFLVIVNEAPWAGSLGLTAHSLTRALLINGQQIAAVFFREEGVYHALEGRAGEGQSLHRQWLELAQQHDVPLMLCSSDSERRFSCADHEGFVEAGLATVLAMLDECDRVLTL